MYQFISKQHETATMELKALIARRQREGKPVDQQVKALALLLQVQQKRELRRLAIERFGRRKAKELRKKAKTKY